LVPAKRGARELPKKFRRLAIVPAGGTGGGSTLNPAHDRKTDPIVAGLLWQRWDHQVTLCSTGGPGARVI